MGLGDEPISSKQIQRASPRPPWKLTMWSWANEVRETNVKSLYESCRTRDTGVEKASAA